MILIKLSSAGDNSNDLLKVTLDLVPNPECNRTFTKGAKDDKLEFGVVGDWQLCAGGLGKDTCQVTTLYLDDYFIVAKEKFISLVGRQWWTSGYFKQYEFRVRSNRCDKFGKTLR